MIGSLKKMSVYAAIVFAFAVMFSLMILAEPVHAAKARTAYVKDPYYFVHKGSKTGKMLTLSYKTKVKVYGALKRSKSQYFKLKAKGKICYTYVKAGQQPFVKKGINYKSYKKKANSEIQQKIVNKAINLLRNKKSKYSHKNKVSGKTAYFDCSGYATYVINGVMQNYVKNYKLSTTISKMQNKKWVFTGKSKFTAKTICNGTPKFAKLKPGDVLFFKEKGYSKVNHVGIYIGNKEFIHSTNQTNGLSIMPLKKAYKKAFVCARRLAPIRKPTPKNVTKKIKESSGANIYKDLKFNNAKTRLAQNTEVKLLFTTPTIYQASFNTCYVQYGTKTSQRGFIQSNKLK